MYRVLFYSAPALSAQDRGQVSSPQLCIKKIYAARVQDSGCILLRQGNFFLSAGLLWQKTLSNPEH